MLYEIAFLKGNYLDFWGTKALELTVDVKMIMSSPTSRLIVALAPSTDSPIIENEQIDLMCNFDRWIGMHGRLQPRTYTPPQTSLLVAAMPSYLT